MAAAVYVHRCTRCVASLVAASPGRAAYISASFVTSPLTPPLFLLFFFFAQNLLGLSGQATLPASTELLVGFDAVGHFVAQLEKRFGHLALFFYDAVSGRSIGVTWRPAAFQLSPLKVAQSEHLMPTTAGANTAGPATKLKPNAVPNVVEIIAEMQQLGEGLVEQIDVL